MRSIWQVYSQHYCNGHDLACEKLTKGITAMIKHTIGGH